MTNGKFLIFLCFATIQRAESLLDDIILSVYKTLPLDTIRKYQSNVRTYKLLINDQQFPEFNMQISKRQKNSLIAGLSPV